MNQPGTIRFGTDGIRGIANSELTPEIALALGRAAARALGSAEFLVGRDTRRSGPLLQASLSAGIAAEGVDVVDLGVLPTPAIAWLSASRDIPAAVISASHNPFQDNGIKLFARGGYKLRAAVEAAIEADITRDIASPHGSRRDAPEGTGVGRLLADPDGRQQYLDWLPTAIDGRDLKSFTVVIDCAAGAASEVAPALLAKLGARVISINDQPEGTNINLACGSTHPERLQQAVTENRADVGLAFDGDADRVIAVDENADLVDGDHLLAMAAADLDQRGMLPARTVVVTVMTNLGFHLAMRQQGIEVVTTPVGDRCIMEEIEHGGYALGGEQSGHIIFRRLATTGDGLLTGMLLLDMLTRRGQTLKEAAASSMKRLPQVLRNVKLRRDREAGSKVFRDLVSSAEEELGATGRVLVRESGTEPLVRVMVEAPTEHQATAVAERLAMAVARELG